MFAASFAVLLAAGVYSRTFGAIAPVAPMKCMGVPTRKRHGQEEVWTSASRSGTGSSSGRNMFNASNHPAWPQRELGIIQTRRRGLDQGPGAGGQAAKGRGPDQR